jgi:germacradienol/geosmin synthase
MMALENSAADYVCLLNDVFSYQKEIQFEGELHNGVLVVENFFGVSRERAIELVNSLMTSRLEQFQHVVSKELPALFDSFELDVDARDVLTGYAGELKNWLAGILRWHEGTGRYDEAELRHHPQAGTEPFGGPVGLGTSAARLGRPPGQPPGQSPGQSPGRPPGQGAGSVLANRSSALDQCRSAASASKVGLSGTANPWPLPA